MNAGIDTAPLGSAWSIDSEGGVSSTTLLSRFVEEPPSFLSAIVSKLVMRQYLGLWSDLLLRVYNSKGLSSAKDMVGCGKYDHHPASGCIITAPQQCAVIDRCESVQVSAAIKHSQGRPFPTRIIAHDQFPLGAASVVLPCNLKFKVSVRQGLAFRRVSTS